MVLVANLVLPRPKAASGQDILLLKIRQNLRQRIVALYAGRGIPVIKAANIGADNLVIGCQEVGVDGALDTVFEQSLVVDGSVRRLGYLEYDGPVRSWLCGG